MFELKNLGFEVERILKIENDEEANTNKKELLKNVKEAIASGDNTDESMGRTLLVWASYLGDIELVKVLVEAGANVNESLGTRNIPLTEANNIDVINYLIKQDTDLEEYGYELLIAAIDDEHVEKLKILLEHIGDINEVDEHGDTVLHYAAKSYASLDIVKLLVDNGMDWKIKNEDGKIALDFAEEEENKRYLESLK